MNLYEILARQLAHELAGRGYRAEISWVSADVVTLLVSNSRRPVSVEFGRARAGNFYGVSAGSYVLVRPRPDRFAPGDFILPLDLPDCLDRMWAELESYL